MGTFGERIRQLEQRIGSGDLVGRVEVDQRYAEIQHNDLTLNHPRGGGPLYLAQPLLDGADGYCQALADSLLDGDLVDAMVDNMEDLSSRVEKTAPVDRNNLRRSGHPAVVDGGVTVYDRAPEQRRLTDAELNQR